MTGVVGDAGGTSEAGLEQLAELAERYYAAGDATRKPLSYLAAYARLFEGRRDAALRILELGVSSGASVLIWRDYLPRAIIVGVDLSEAPASLEGQERIHFVRGSQDDPEILDRAARVAGGEFDLIIDDASHIGYLTKRSFIYLFPRWLARGGWYVIEDLGTAFMPEYPDGESYQTPAWEDAVPGAVVFEGHQHGMLGVVKQLIDHMMQELSTGVRSYLPVDSITIEPNIAFIRKSREPGSAWPKTLPSGHTPSRIDVAASISEIREELARQNGQIQDMAKVLGRVVGLLRPFRIGWRALTGRGAVPPLS